MKSFYIKALIFIVLIGLISCASIHSGYYAEQIDDNGRVINKKKTDIGLVVSAKEDTDLSSKYFGLVNLTFENKSQGWIRIKKVTIDFFSEVANENVKFTSGNDLALWQEAIIKRNEIREHNRDMFLASVAIIGTTVAMSSDNKALKAAGAFTGLGALTSLTVNEYNKVLHNIENAKIFPRNHLFAEEFVVPPGLFSKKWVLLNTTNHRKTGFLNFFLITYETDDGKKETIKLQFRSSGTITEWQKEVQYNHVED
ncbi:MAG: hypothetical protein CVV44_09405 [Spirochaetae bacterium HGW-Spirochaetae-1]|jgi:hypothetical protein|nr:MAG: hypothetical protein CVV44_09405 [Spirochaetae bacterium HGW-Spirochaetae-1]